MNPSSSAKESPDYGIDAPGVVRNLFLAAGLGLLASGTALSGLWPGQFKISAGSLTLIFPVTGIGLSTGVLCAFMGCWMLWDSKIGKLRSRERLLNHIDWTGREHVLDVGCGRGLLLIGAARRLVTGKAIGIDIWQTQDLSGNRLEATLENARREGVAGRIDVETADMRKIPFASGTFDVVVSRAAIHNLYTANDRAQAVSEIVRVLKPGGKAIIEDIRHLTDYAEIFTRNGLVVRHAGSVALAALLMLITFGSLRPGTLVARKSK